ncbi:transketolase [Patescibacteria group bacterium]|nr:transketolase [Patescibacteria group bacterium]MBU1896085.1 transketolase [Patescibacteria group bacterium]
MNKELREAFKLLRYYILKSTTQAGSGHPTTCLSAVELMGTLMFGGFFRADLDSPEYHNNDRLIFSKGHAAPLLYALYALAGKVSEKQLMSLRKINSPLEGHPTMRFPYTEVATGSLGQGLSIGVGMAMNAKYLDKLGYRTYVLLGDSEMAEGSVWEAMEIASHYKLNNLVAIVDVNRLGQNGETMHGHNMKIYKAKAEAFGWEAIVINGHNITEVARAYKKASMSRSKPVMILAKTQKGKGVSFAENKNDWHGRALTEKELKQALVKLEKVKTDLKLFVNKPDKIASVKYNVKNVHLAPLKTTEPIAVRKAYGRGLVEMHKEFPNMVVLDAETENSTYAKIFKNNYPNRFFEMYIAEQNMVGVALGLSKRGKLPFISTFGAFFTRAYDQIRMSQYSNANIKFVGSHAGVSIGVDGSSQMALEDISMFRTIQGSVVLYPSDAVSMLALMKKSAKHVGMVYIRSTRNDTPIIYKTNESFVIGGSKVLKSSNKDKATIVTAGITLHEAIKAYDELGKQGIKIRIIDLYSIKPIDKATLDKAVKDTGCIITVEDHYREGGLGEAVRSALPGVRVHSLFVTKMPRSGTGRELLAYEGIDAHSIIKKIKSCVK